MVRILAVNPGSDFDAIVSKLEKLSKQKSSFDAILLLSCPSSARAMPIPTYFAAESFEGSEEKRTVAEHLHYVGPSALKILNGLAVLLVAEGTESMFSANVDVLVSGAPSGVGNDEKATRLGLRVKPKYHFFPSEKFEKYEPFVLRGCSYATRMIQVAEMGRSKWLFAADITPIAEIGEREFASGKVLYEVGKSTAQKRRRRECWFCLSNKVEEHLVTYVGKEVYVAVAKGGLNESHLVIVPVSHVTSCMDINDTTREEIERIMDGIGRYYREKRSGEGFFFERVVSNNQHLQGTNEKTRIMHMCVQAICIKDSKSGALEDEIVNGGERLGFENLKMNVGGGQHGSAMREVRRKGWRDAFWAQLSSGRQIAVECSERRLMPPIFGRVVAARVLGTPQRIAWRDCVLTKEQEQAIAEQVAIDLDEFIKNG
ncbi:HIT-like protein [Gracilaria domingensis]|nr:HIT-like protein [Gracilaria domingensis]